MLKIRSWANEKRVVTYRKCFLNSVPVIPILSLRKYMDNILSIDISCNMIVRGRGRIKKRERLTPPPLNVFTTE